MNSSSRQAAAASVRSSRSSAAHRVGARRRRASTALRADCDGVEQEAVPERLRVDLLGAVLERGEGHRAGREADAGADRADVVQVVVDALELEQHRAGDARARGRAAGRARPRRPARRRRVLATAHAAQARCDVGAAHRRRDAALGGALEAAVLVEEPRVHREDPLADDVEAEVPGLDHAGVDRADRDLVDAVAASPASSRRPGRRRVLTSGAHRCVAGEPQSVEVVRFALVPAARPRRARRCCRRLRSGASVTRSRGPRARRANSARQPSAPSRALAQARRSARRAASARSIAVRHAPGSTCCSVGHSVPRVERLDEARADEQQAGREQREQAGAEDRRERHGRALPAVSGGAGGRRACRR